MHPLAAEALVRAQQDEAFERASAGSAVGPGAAAGRRRIPTAPRRTLATAATIEAFFAFAWFGWGQAAPTAVVSVILAAGAAMAVLVAATAGATARRLRAAPSPLGPAAAGRYGVIVGVEFAVAGGGAAAFGATGHADLIPAWICLVVGIHFLPLDRIFPGAGMKVPAAALSVVGVAAFAAAGGGVSPSTVTGLGAGACLLAHATSMLLAARRDPEPEYP